MTGYTNGRRHEYLVRDELEAFGYRCVRAAGSKGKADIVALKPGVVLLVQVKVGGPQIAPQERSDLFEMAQDAGALAIVAHKPLRQPITYRWLTGTGPKDWQTWAPTSLALNT